MVSALLATVPHMSHFVLVPGAWHGAWVWDRVVPRLEATGHTAEPLTLPGVGERAGETQVHLATHAEDIARAVRRAPGEPVVVVSHSYSGLPVLQAVDGLGDAVARVVHVDSVVAGNGAAFADPQSVWGQRMLATLEANGGYWPPQLNQLEGQGLADDDIALISQRVTPHPGATLTEPLELRHPLSDVPTAYLHCLLDTPEFDDDLRDLAEANGWTVEHLQAGHWVMLSEPAMLVEALLRYA
jgi:pimeloyl-ACP methyl ester carboxylesterase